jgi:hypothetical protein
MEDGTYQRADGEYEIPNVTTVPGANVWTVDDDGVQCPNAEFEHIQEAVEYASPWDTIVVCPGTYYESSTPVNSELNPVLAEGEKDGLTINKPLKIIGAGANKVTIKPATSLTTLGGSTGTLRDGGGNVITVSRQSLGSTEYDENFVDISGVKIESGSTTAEAGVAFFNASGRIANSEIGTIKAANGNSWGVVMTNSQIGEGAGAAERQVTIENSKIKGYTTGGGVLFDDSKGKADAAATNYERSGMKQVGYVKDTVIEGSATGASATVAQSGIVVSDGAVAHISGSVIANNRYSTEPKKSAGRSPATATASTTPTPKTKPCVKARRPPPPMTIGAVPGRRSSARPWSPNPLRKRISTKRGSRATMRRKPPRCSSPRSSARPRPRRLSAPSPTCRRSVRSSTRMAAKPSKRG